MDVNFESITAYHRQPFGKDDAVSGTLNVVLKYNNGGYIRRRVARSPRMLGDVSKKPAPSRLVVTPSSKYRECIINAEWTLLAVSLYADFIVADIIE